MTDPTPDAVEMLAASYELPNMPPECRPMVVAATLRALQQRITELTADNKRLSGVIENDRTVVAIKVNEISAEIAGRAWLLYGRGPYEWDDDRYRDEFSAALKAIDKPIAALKKIARDWTDCPTDQKEIDAARIDWKSRAAKAEAERDNALAQAGAAAADMRERAAAASINMRDNSGFDMDGVPYVNEEAHLYGSSVADAILSDIRALPLNPDAEAALKRVRKEAFVAGFMSTREGCNGEYVRSGDCEAVARDCADSWISRTEAPHD